MLILLFYIGVVKFWKRIGSGAPSSPVDPVGIEFVKSYQAHSSSKFSYILPCIHDLIIESYAYFIFHCFHSCNVLETQ